MIERLDMNSEYSAIENAIHLSRYSIVKNICKNKNVLDVACGEGYGSFLVSKWKAKKVTGIDISEEAIKKANKLFKNDNLEFLTQDATKMKKIKNNYYDVVVSFETFEHVNDPDMFLEEIKRVSKNDSTIIISCPNDYYYYPSNDTFNPYHVRKYSFEDFSNIIKKHFKGKIDFMLGTEVNGYINSYLSNEEIPKSNLIITKDTKKIDCMKVPNGKVQDDKLCNYYVAIINNCGIEENGTIFSWMYSDWKETTEHLNNDITILKENNKELKETIEHLNNDIITLKNNNKELREEKSRLNINYDRMNQINKILTAEKESVSQWAHNEYKLNQELNNMNQELNNMLNAIMNSRSYKLTRKIVKLVKRR